VVATSSNREDDEIAARCAQENVVCSRGSADDVLDRFYRAAREQSAEVVLRATGDCPLIDPELVTRLIEMFGKEQLDYCGIGTGAGVAGPDFKEGRFPDGLDTEVFTFAALERTWREAKESLCREHVTPYFFRHPELFKLGCLTSKTDYSQMRWTVDHEEDFLVVKAIIEGLYPTNPRFGITEILDFLKEHEELQRLNADWMKQTNYGEFWKGPPPS
jgi:spore coat polysaccharide biosynthesis protein SpsF (cytidylyltransferase family)